MGTVFTKVVLGQVSRRDQEFDVGDTQMRRRPPEHPGWRVLLVLIDSLVEVDLVQVTADGEPVQGDVLLATLAPQIIAEVHRPTYLQKPIREELLARRHLIIGIGCRRPGLETPDD